MSDADIPSVPIIGFSPGQLPPGAKGTAQGISQQGTPPKMIVQYVKLRPCSHGIFWSRTLRESSSGVQLPNNLKSLSKSHTDLSIGFCLIFIWNVQDMTV